MYVVATVHIILIVVNTKKLSEIIAVRLVTLCFKKQRDNGSRNSGHSNYAKKVHNIDEDVNTDSYDTVFSVQGQENEFVPLGKKTVYINNKPVEFEVDTGGGVTLMS